MNGFEELLLTAGQYFTDNYLVTTKIQGILWSAADIILIYFFLKIINFIQSKMYGKKNTSGYIFLLISAFFTFLLPFTKTSQEFFIMEVIICAIQYSILIIIMVSTRKDIFLFLKKVFEKG
jgi:hypothetical protein